MTRIKKILHADPDLPNVNANAAFAIAAATEQFLQYFALQTHTVVRAERGNSGKPRRTVQYKDVAHAVARHDNLEFLTDVVPRTISVKQHREKIGKEREIALKAVSGSNSTDGEGDGVQIVGSREGEKDDGTTMEVEHEDDVQSGPEGEGIGLQVVIPRMTRPDDNNHMGQDVMDIDAIAPSNIDQPHHVNGST